MHNSAKTSFSRKCQMTFGGHITSNDVNSHDATIAPIDGIEMTPKYRIISFKNGLGVVQRVK